MKKEYKSPVMRMIPLSLEGIIADSGDPRQKFRLDPTEGGDPNGEVLSRDNNNLWDDEW